MRTLKNLVVTIVLLLAAGVVVFLATLLPGKAIQSFFIKNWIGFAGGIILSHAVLLFTSRRKKQDDDEDDEE